MTPFGAEIRKLRKERGISQKEMADALSVSPAYLSALEHGRRGQPNWDLIQRIIGFFNVIWDEAEELQRAAALSNPRTVVDTSGLSPAATELANRLADVIGLLDEEEIAEMINRLKRYKEDPEEVSETGTRGRDSRET